MIPFSHLVKGLNAMARAHHMNAMAGHLGASFIAGYFVGEQRPNLDTRVFEGIEADLQRVQHGDSVFGQQMSKSSTLTDAALFEPFPQQQPEEGLADSIAEALEKTIDRPRQSGHNVIFASLAIRALKQHPQLSIPALADGIRRLIRLFEAQHAGSGYYGKQRGRLSANQIKLPANDQTPEYEDIPSMAQVVLRELAGMDKTYHRIGYGDMVHIINHAAAIVDLSNSGYPDLALRAVPAHREHLRLWKNLPNVADEKGPMIASKVTAHNAAYWSGGAVPDDRALLTHRVKTLYGFDQLTTALDQDALEALAYDKLRLLM